ncbi:hypothetical protein [Roseivirga pacifica]|jgi:SAM-dependent methyltransferase|uniref:hypothetical protein n=1 Tax=Roseivirga pacifica TaxID=1267423 RepID=UPI003BAA5000
MNLEQKSMNMAQSVGFFGIPSENFDQSGRAQFIALLELGLLPQSSVLEIGCGVLRAGHWLINFLEPDNYYGIEPSEKRVQLGLDQLISKSVQIEKKPRFNFNDEFDLTVFDKKFDFFLAGSIWTHCSKLDISTMLDGFKETGTDNSVFLVSYLPAFFPWQDYKGSDWVGTSHKSEKPGCIHHNKKWIKRQAKNRGLHISFLNKTAFDNQYWIVLSKAPLIKDKTLLSKRLLRFYHALKN